MIPNIENVPISDVFLCESDRNNIGPIKFDSVVFGKVLSEIEPVFHYLREDDLLNLAEGTVTSINHCLENRLEAIIFLDKSARPASYLFRKTWQVILPNFEQPNILFINIGRRHAENPKIIGSKFNSSFKKINRFLAGMKVGLYDECTMTQRGVEGDSVLKYAMPLLGIKTPQIAEIIPHVMYNKPPTWIRNRISGDWSAIGVSEDERSLFVVPVNRDDKIFLRIQQQLRSELSTLAQITSYSCYL